MSREHPRRCARVQRHLPGLVDGSAPALRARLVRRHLHRCEACAEEHVRQQAVAGHLETLGRLADDEADLAPPPDLLDALLERTSQPSLAARVAVPARGAVSGARPGLSVALVVTLLVMVGLGAWLGWRAGRAWVAVRDGGAGTSSPRREP